jgi:excisionase family DNA binding protein
MRRSSTHDTTADKPSVEPHGKESRDWVPFPGTPKRQHRDKAEADSLPSLDLPVSPTVGAAVTRLQATGIHSEMLLTAGPLLDLLILFVDQHDHLRRWMPRSDGVDVIAFATTQLEQAVRAASRSDAHVTPAEAARLLGVSPSTIRLWVRHGTLAAKRQWYRLQISRRALNELSRGRAVG